MIKFDGYISGSAEQFFWKKARKFGQILILASMLVLLPIFIYASVKTSMWGILAGYAVVFVLIQMCTFIPASKKDRKSLIPKCVYIEDGYIVCIADKYEEYKAICDVEAVVDHCEFYELRFSFGKTNEKFICQKDLLVSGSLEDFEALFNEKIQKVN